MQLMLKQGEKARTIHALKGDAPTYKPPLRRNKKNFVTSGIAAAIALFTNRTEHHFVSQRAAHAT
jgi:hypothetical protein